MPFIDARLTVPVSEEQQESLKTAFGQALPILHKSENYLMVSITGGAPLWFGGRKLDKGAYVAVSLFGNAPADACEKMTGKICDILADQLGIPGDGVYVTYHPVSDWGWNGSNF